MRHQELLYNVTGQSFAFDPIEGQASGTPTVTVQDAANDDDGQAEVATTGVATVDTVNTFPSAAASAGSRVIVLTSATGVAKGRRYQFTNAAGLLEWVEVAGINGTSITLRQPLQNAHTTGSTFKGTRISIAVLSAWIQDENKITEWAAGHAGYRVRWQYVVGGVTLVAATFADVVRYSSKNLVTALDVDARFPGWIDRLPTDYQADQGEALIAESMHAVRMDAIGDSQVMRRIRNTEIVRELVMYRAQWMAAELQTIARGTNPEAMAAAKAAYEQRYNQLTREPKFPVDNSTGGASSPAKRSSIWRR